MKKIMLAAHKMTKELVEKYGVDYQAQLGLCISYLIENKEENQMTNLKGTEKQISYAKDLIAKLQKYVDRVHEGYEKGEALEEEKEEFVEFYNETLKPVLENEKSSEVIYKLKDKVKELWYLEDENFLENFKNDMNNDDVEYEYNLANEIYCKLKSTFKRG